MPSVCEALSRAYIAAPAASASACADAANIDASGLFMEAASGGMLAAQQRRHAITVLAIRRCEIGQHGDDLRQAYRIGPCQRTARIVDALEHRDVRRRRVAHALVDDIGRLV